MNVNWIRLKSIARELHGIRSELSRIADIMELDLADKGIHLKAREEGKPESSLEYVDEQMDWGRENIPHFDELMEREHEKDESLPRA